MIHYCCCVFYGVVVLFSSIVHGATNNEVLGPQRSAITTEEVAARLQKENAMGHG